MKKRKRIVCPALALFSATLFFALLFSAFSSASDPEVDRFLFGEPTNVEACFFAPDAAGAEEHLPQDKPSDDIFEAIAERDFEKQDKRVYVNGGAYPGFVLYGGDTYRVDPSYFASFIGCDTAIECRPGDIYYSVNGRCLYCPETVALEDGAASVPLRELSAAFGLTWRESDGDIFLEGEAALPESGDDHYPADDLYWLSRIISCESMSESMTGKIAVGNVVLNRAASPDFPDDVEGVVFDRRYGIVQFSPVAGGYIYAEPDRESVCAAKLCLEGVSLSDSILYFMNPDIADTTWISDNREAVMTIGHHTFYS